jgi:TetR/AcrR family transcriptional regulator, transcriptional repressor for nem operon
MDHFNIIRTEKMRYAPDQKDRSRLKILTSASRMLRRDGIEGVSVGAAMKDAGMTHGAFYAHFASKDDLVAESIRFALDETIDRLRNAALEATNEPPLSAIVATYLNESHLRKPWNGCATASLGQQAARSSPQIRSAMANKVDELIDLIAEYTPGANKKARRSLAQAIYATMVGAIVIAMAYDKRSQQQDILESARESISAMTRGILTPSSLAIRNRKLDA